MTEPFVHASPAARVVLAPGALDRVPEELDLIARGRVLLIAGGSAVEAADRLQERLTGRAVTRFSYVRQHVPQDLAARAATQAQGAGVVVSIGGGSATGLAKIVALRTGLPVLAVPTTYAGSEMTAIWGMTRDGEKLTGTDPAVLPRTVVYDPELSRRLPLDVTVPSVANAMAHCLEATWTAGSDPITRLTAIEGARALDEGLRQIQNDPINIVARSNLLYGACLAGRALACAGTGLHHKICHVLGGRYALPHAQTHAAVLPHVTAYNASVLPAALTTIGIGLHDLFQPGGLKDLGLTAEQAAEVAETMPLPENPVPLGRTAFRTLVQHAWEGGTPLWTT